MRLHRELHDEAAAVAVVALDEDAAAMRLDDVLDNGEPETGRARCIAIGAVLREAFEDVVAYFRGDAGPAIGDLELREINSRGSRDDLDGAALGSVAQRVADEVGDYPGELDRVALQIG